MPNGKRSVAKVCRRGFRHTGVFVVRIMAGSTRYTGDLNLVSAYKTADYRAVLERGDILFFPDGGFRIPEDVRTALTGTAQNSRSFHKNISYKPNVDRVSGLSSRNERESVGAAMRAYSRSALDFLRRILPEYSHAWSVDYASFRSIEERGRELPLNKRNDLLHVDAFPTRPVFGNLILRCFTNVNPQQSREWVTSDPFAILAPREAESANLSRYARRAGSWWRQRVARKALRGIHRIGLPVTDRSPYDAFMLHFHDWLKANRGYQESSPKYRFSLPPGSTWLVFTDVVPHAVMEGQYALEQTVIVSRESLLSPGSAPVSILERIAGRSLVP